jgi:hypothetical protein
MIGALGIVVFTIDGVDAIEIPPELVAVTVNVYGVLDVNPITLIDVDIPVVVTTGIPVTVDALVTV